MAHRVFRKTWIIDSTQNKLLSIIIVYILVTLSLSAVLIFALARPGPMPEQMAGKEMLLLHARFWPTILFITAIICLHSFFVFHKIFGPLSRFRNIFNNIAEGDLSPLVKIRKNDYLKAEEIAIRQMLTSLNTEISHLQKDHLELQNTMLALKRNIQESEEISRGQLLAQLDSLEILCARMDKHLRHFRT